MYFMDRQQRNKNPSQARVNEYLSRFKSNDTALTGTDTASENTLDQHLLEKAAEELRAARARVDKLKRELSKN